MEYDDTVYRVWEDDTPYQIRSDLNPKTKEQIEYLFSDGSCERIAWCDLERLVFPGWEFIPENYIPDYDPEWDDYPIEDELYGLQKALIEQGYIKFV